VPTGELLSLTVIDRERGTSAALASLSRLDETASLARLTGSIIIPRLETAVSALIDVETPLAATLGDIAPKGDIIYTVGDDATFELSYELGERHEVNPYLLTDVWLRDQHGITYTALVVEDPLPLLFLVPIAVAAAGALAWLYWRQAKNDKAAIERIDDTIAYAQRHGLPYTFRYESSSQVTGNAGKLSQNGTSTFKVEVGSQKST
jgi:hypothetical protein